ncbi:MAG: PEP/pyruvate-binding domain-containing protein [Marinilabiliales bacterium]
MAGKEETSHNIVKLLHEKEERLKELQGINKTVEIIKHSKSVENSLNQIARILPAAFQYPENTCSIISYGNRCYKSANFKETKWFISQKFETINDKQGEIKVFYTKKFPDEYEGPFLKEEIDLLNNIANIITGYINSQIGRNILDINKTTKIQSEKDDSFSITRQEIKKSGKYLLQRFISKYNEERDIFHDLMPFKVKEILLIANLYDAFIIEKEGRFSEHILGEYHQLNLTSLPRITGVSSKEDALKQLELKHYDLVIIMMGVDKKTPVEISKEIKSEYPYIPVYLLLNNNQDIELFEKNKNLLNPIDKLFVWNGDSKIFFAMVKSLEDKINMENDTKIGMVRVILLVEDSPKYYSRYLPLLYQIVLEQTKHLIEEVNNDELYKVLKLRARPKIIHASNFEEAVDIFNNYKHYLLCVISDVKFPKKNRLNNNAGIDLINYVRKELPNMPVVLQSSDTSVEKRANELQSAFIHKNSETLAQDVRSFISYYLGFGNFIYRNKKGQQIAVAKSLNEFEQILKTIPEESIIYHAIKNHFSLWLMARGEIHIAKEINNAKVDDFNSPEEIRTFLLKTISQYREDREKGRIVQFTEEAFMDPSNIVLISSGALGGKGRGLAFINTLIYSFNFNKIIPGISIQTPRTAIIGTDEFDMFIERNNLREIIFTEIDYNTLQQHFIEGDLSYNLIKRLKQLIKLLNKPIAIRSSSLFEDSLMQPFSGVFATYLLPNNHPDINIRLQQAMTAIKLVYSSIYSNHARRYFEAINYKIEEEKMAVIIQEVVGNMYDKYYYPHISGTAQSHNYYPVAHMKPDEGFAVAAVGLGTYVVEGEKTYRFSPAYPQIDIISPKDLYKSSQTMFYAIDLNKQNLNLLDGENAGLIKLDIDVAEKLGTLKHCASVFDVDNERITPGLDRPGPRVIDFANILKYNYIPMAETISTMLDIIKDALGSPVEIEYAIDLNKNKEGLPTFYLLQIKPLVGNEDDYNIDLEKIDKSKLILYSEKSMGNGMIDDIYDIIYVPPESFNNTQTLEIAEEIEKLNEEMIKENRKYILIGPGRWGTRDRFIGIPVVWSQISNAKIIVEMSLEDFPLDASLGSHFFHNVTSMNVGYFSIQHQGSSDFINWDILNNQKPKTQTKYFKRISFNKPVIVKMDGKKRISVILTDNE